MARNVISLFFIGCPESSDASRIELSLLSDRHARLGVGGGTDVADLHRLDADAAEDELAIERLAHAHVDDLALAGERGDGVVGRTERADVLVRERRRRGRRRRWRRRRNGPRVLAVVADAV